MSFTLTYVADLIESRYASDALPSVAMNLLGLTNAREIANPDEFPLLEARLKHVRVRQIVAGKLGRIRTIRKLVQRAGYERFFTRDGTEMTVRVRRVIGVIQPWELFIFWTF